MAQSALRCSWAVLSAAASGSEGGGTDLGPLGGWLVSTFGLPGGNGRGVVVWKTARGGEQAVTPSAPSRDLGVHGRRQRAGGRNMEVILVLCRLVDIMMLDRGAILRRRRKTSSSGEDGGLLLLASGLGSWNCSFARFVPSKGEGALLPPRKSSAQEGKARLASHAVPVCSGWIVRVAVYVGLGEKKRC